MKQHHATIDVQTAGQGLTDITARVADVVRQAAVSAGACTLLLRHTSAGLVIQENADPAVGRDLQRAFERLAPEGEGYEHDAEGPDDMPAHLRAVLTPPSLTIPILSGGMRLGRWQAIYLWEHRRSGQRREVAVLVMGE